MENTLQHKKTLQKEDSCIPDNYIWTLSFAVFFHKLLLLFVSESFCYHVSVAIKGIDVKFLSVKTNTPTGKVSVSLITMQHPISKFYGVTLS